MDNMEKWFQILSELFINLAAGWFALVFIVPNPKAKRWMLTANIV